MAELLESSKIFYTPYEPKLKNRFIMEIGGIPAFTIKTAQRPQITFEKIELEHMNITLYDPIVPSAAASVMEWVRLHHESATGRDGYQDFYKKNCNFKVLGPVGDIIEKWTLYGTYISDASFGDLDFSDSQPVEIALTLTFDYAILEF